MGKLTKGLSYTKKELQDYLRITDVSVCNLIKSEKVKAFRVGANGKWNILKSSVKQMLKNLNEDKYDE